MTHVKSQKHLTTDNKVPLKIQKSLFLGIFLLLLLGLICITAPNKAQAATIIVNYAADTTTGADGVYTLREAITNANNNAQTYADCAAGSGNDTIVFDASIGAATILLSSTLPAIVDVYGLTIDGDSRITVSGNNTVQVFHVNSGVPLTLQNITVANGSNAASGKGGGMYGVMLCIKG
jgi:hypothetical protein